MPKINDECSVNNKVTRSNWCGPLAVRFHSFAFDHLGLYPTLLKWLIWGGGLLHFQYQGRGRIGGKNHRLHLGLEEHHIHERVYNHVSHPQTSCSRVSPRAFVGNFGNHRSTRAMYRLGSSGNEANRIVQLPDVCGHMGVSLQDALLRETKRTTALFCGGGGVGAPPTGNNKRYSGRPSTLKALRARSSAPSSGLLQGCLLGVDRFLGKSPPSKKAGLRRWNPQNNWELIEIKPC